MRVIYVVVGVRETYTNRVGSRPRAYRSRDSTCTTPQTHRGADVRAVREAEVEEEELALEIRVGAGPPVEVHKGPGPAQRGLAVGRHLPEGCVCGLVGWVGVLVV